MDNIVNTNTNSKTEHSVNQNAVNASTSGDYITLPTRPDEILEPPADLCKNIGVKNLFKRANLDSEQIGDLKCEKILHTLLQLYGLKELNKKLNGGEVFNYFKELEEFALNKSIKQAEKTVKETKPTKAKVSKPTVKSATPTAKSVTPTAKSGTKSAKSQPSTTPKPKPKEEPKKKVVKAGSAAQLATGKSAAAKKDDKAGKGGIKGALSKLKRGAKTKTGESDDNKESKNFKDNKDKKDDKVDKGGVMGALSKLKPGAKTKTGESNDNKESKNSKDKDNKDKKDDKVGKGGIKGVLSKLKPGAKTKTGESDKNKEGKDSKDNTDKKDKGVKRVKRAEQQTVWQLRRLSYESPPQTE